ncbi:MAG: response regulator [Thermodesulfobacteriota bacterium]
MGNSFPIVRVIVMVSFLLLIPIEYLKILSRVNYFFMRVLIIERDKTVSDSLCYFLERHRNCEVFLAGSKREGESLLKSLPFDIVLCGDRLPDGNGLEVLREWTSQNPNLISILMTVQSDEKLKQEALRAGIRGYLEKPFNLRQLEEAIFHSKYGTKNAK